MANLMLLLVLSSISMASCLASYPPDGYRSRYHPPTYQTYDRRLIDSYNNVATTDAYPRKYEEPRSNSYTSTNHGSYSGRSYKNSYPNAGGIYQKAYNSLQSAYKPAQTTYTSVESAYKPAKTSYTSVGSAYKPAKTSYTSVGSAYKPAKTSYTSVESAYKPTKNTYTPLQSAYKPSHGAYKPAGSAYSPARSAYKQIKGHGKDYYGTAGKEYGGSSSYGSYQTRNTYSTPHGEYQAPRYQLNTPMSHTTYNMNDEYIESQAYRPESYDDPCHSLPEGDYSLQGDFKELFYGVDNQCNFVKCANNKAYINACSIGTKNGENGGPHPEYGFCANMDYNHYCGHYQ